MAQLFWLLVGTYPKQPLSGSNGQSQTGGRRAREGLAGWEMEPLTPSSALWIQPHKAADPSHQVLTGSAGEFVLGGACTSKLSPLADWPMSGPGLLGWGANRTGAGRL